MKSIRRDLIDPDHFLPRGAMVFAQLDALMEKTEGGIILTSSVVEKDKYDMDIVTVIRCGDDAFSSNVAFGPKPAKGERVLIDKFAGKLFEGVDGRHYRVFLDENVRATITDEPIVD